MAGPGGGPPRKSHTKSKKGCKTCKKRHIRCDETYPQCKNCTKHNVRCDYNDQITQDNLLDGSLTALAYNPSPEQEIDQWVATGVFPFVELNVQNTNQFSHFGRTDLRLLHYLCNSYRMLSSVDAVHCAPWLSQLPTFLEISGRGHSCVLSALLAFSAQRLADGPNAQEMANLADNYRAHALAAIQKALSEFSQHNSDSILATSIILSWQVDDLEGWNHLMTGVSTVIQAMGDWRLSSPIASFAEDHVLARPMGVAGESALPNAIAALQQMSESIPQGNPVRACIDGIWAAGINLGSIIQTLPAQQVFERLGYLRNQVLWAPLDLIPRVGANDLSMVALAHIFSMASAVDASIPDLNGASLGALTNFAIRDIDRRLRFASPTSVSSQDHWEGMMQFPRHIAERFAHSVSMEPTFSFTQHETSLSGSSYGMGNLNLGSTPGTPPYPPGSQYLESQGAPPSPYLPSYEGTVSYSHRHSGHFSHRPTSIYSHDGSLVPPALNSPGFSPAYSPQPFSDGETPELFYGNEHSPAEPPMGYTSGLVNHEVWV